MRGPGLRSADLGGSLRARWAWFHAFLCPLLPCAFANLALSGSLGAAVCWRQSFRPVVFSAPLHLGSNHLPQDWSVRTVKVTRSCQDSCKTGSTRFASKVLYRLQVICPLGRPRQAGTPSVFKSYVVYQLSGLPQSSANLPSSEMAAGSSPEEVQDHWSAAWRQGVRARLAKKATFEAAVAELEKALRASPAAASDPAVAELIERSFTLLRTRYTAPGFWSAGRALYASASKASQLASSLLTHQRWHGTCQTLIHP